MQKCYRGHRARRYFHELKEGVISLQSCKKDLFYNICPLFIPEKKMNLQVTNCGCARLIKDVDNVNEIYIILYVFLV